MVGAGAVAAGVWFVWCVARLSAASFISLTISTCVHIGQTDDGQTKTGTAIYTRVCTQKSCGRPGSEVAAGNHAMPDLA